MFLPDTPLDYRGPSLRHISEIRDFETFTRRTRRTFRRRSRSNPDYSPQLETLRSTLRRLRYESRQVNKLQILHLLRRSEKARRALSCIHHRCHHSNGAYFRLHGVVWDTIDFFDQITQELRVSQGLLTGRFELRSHETHQASERYLSYDTLDRIEHHEEYAERRVFHPLVPIRDQPERNRIEH